LRLFAPFLAFTKAQRRSPQPPAGERNGPNSPTSITL